MDEATVNGRTLKLVEGDITALDVDAIVNPANRHLQLGGGVAGAIRRKGGPAIQREANAIGGCPVGGAVITTGGDLPARHVIHAVGPHGGDPDADEKLASATRAALAVADANGLAVVALPAISTGIFGYPMDDCARIMIRTIRDHLSQSGAGLDEVILCLYGQEAYDVFAAELARQMGAD
jgi:O-acetyl-ADP-ribose deacetylase (regulator of RNase III)